MHYNSIRYTGKFRDLKALGYTYSDWSIMNWSKKVGVREDNFRIYKQKSWMSISEFTNFEGYLLLFLINLRATGGMLEKIRGFREPEVFYASLYINRRTGEISNNRAHEMRQMERFHSAKKVNPNSNFDGIFEWMGHFTRWDILEELVMMYDKGLVVPIIDKETYNY